MLSEILLMGFDNEVRSLTIEQLVNKLRNASKDEASTYATEIIRRFEKLFRKAWKRAAIRLDYQDFVQEVFCRFFSRLPALKDAGALPGLLQKIAHGVAVDSFRKQSTDPMANAEAIEAAVRPFDDETIKSIPIRYCLEMLPPRYKEVFELRMIEGLTVEETADALQMSKPGVTLTTFRARKALQRLLIGESKKLERKNKKEKPPASDL